MADLKENAIALLNTGVYDMTTGAKITLYEIPTGKKCIVTHVVVRNRTGVLGGQYDFGSDGAASDWVQNVDLSTLGADEYMVIQDEPAAGVFGNYPVMDDIMTFGVNRVAGAAFDATIDVFGYLFDA